MNVKYFITTDVNFDFSVSISPKFWFLPSKFSKTEFTLWKKILKLDKNGENYLCLYHLQTVCLNRLQNSRVWWGPSPYFRERSQSQFMYVSTCGLHMSHFALECPKLLEYSMFDHTGVLFVLALWYVHKKIEFISYNAKMQCQIRKFSEIRNSVKFQKFRSIMWNFRRNLHLSL